MHVFAMLQAVRTSENGPNAAEAEAGAGAQIEGAGDGAGEHGSWMGSWCGVTTECPVGYCGRVNPQSLCILGEAVMTSPHG
jgi:hypothetical protein